MPPSLVWRARVIGEEKVSTEKCLHKTLLYASLLGVFLTNAWWGYKHPCTSVPEFYKKEGQATEWENIFTIPATDK